MTGDFTHQVQESQLVLSELHIQNMYARARGIGADSERWKRQGRRLLRQWYEVAMDINLRRVIRRVQAC